MDFKTVDLLEYEQHSFHGDRKQLGDNKLGRNQKSAKIQKRTTTDKKCTSCGTTSTPVWRWGGEAKEVLLCNACSLRIRRSATRPQRAKSPTDVSSQKHSPALPVVDDDSPGPTVGLSDLGPADAEALRSEVLQCVEFHLGLERARLLGPREAVSGDEEWPVLQRASAYSGCMPVPASTSTGFGRDYGPISFAQPQPYVMPEHEAAIAYGVGEHRQLRML